eukprot:jgi/Psemu1/53242/gm1.53242_g
MVGQCQAHGKILEVVYTSGFNLTFGHKALQLLAVSNGKANVLIFYIISKINVKLDHGLILPLHILWANGTSNFSVLPSIPGPNGSAKLGVGLLAPATDHTTPHHTINDYYRLKRYHLPPDADFIEVMLINNQELSPGARVSSDQYMSTTLGHLAHTLGKESKQHQRMGGTVFVDHSSNYIHHRHR